MFVPFQLFPKFYYLTDLKSTIKTVTIKWQKKLERYRGKISEKSMDVV